MNHERSSADVADWKTSGEKAYHVPEACVPGSARAGGAPQGGVPERRCQEAHSSQVQYRFVVVD